MLSKYYKQMAEIRQTIKNYKVSLNLLTKLWKGNLTQYYLKKGKKTPAQIYIFFLWKQKTSLAKKINIWRKLFKIFSTGFNKLKISPTPLPRDANNLRSVQQSNIKMPKSTVMAPQNYHVSETHHTVNVPQQENVKQLVIDIV